MPGKDTAIVSPNFTVAIPETVRDAMQLQIGQEVAFLPQAGGIMLVPVPSREHLAGLAKGACPDGYRDRGDRV